MKKKSNSRLTSIRVATIYFLICSAYIIFSDKILLQLFNDEKLNSALSEIQTYKGVFFVFFSSFLIYYLLKKRDLTEKEYNTGLKISQKQYQNLFKNMSHGVVYATPKGIVTSINKSTSEILGITEKEMIGKSIFDVSWKTVTPDGKALEVDETPAKKALINKKPEFNHILGVTNVKTGLHNWLKVNAIPEFKNGEDDPFRICITIDDITQLKNYQQELEESQKSIKSSLKKTQFSEFLLKEASKMAKIGVYEIYTDTNETYFSDELYEIFNISNKKQFLIDRTPEIILKELKSNIQEAVKNCMESGTLIDEEIQLKTENENYYWARVIVKPIYDNNNKIIGRRGVVQDITDRKKIEEKVLRSEQRFKALVQEGFDLFAVLDIEGKYIYMSPSSSKVIGIPPEEFIGKEAFKYIHSDDLESASKSFNEVITKDRVVMEHYRAKNQKGEWRWVETVLTNMIDNPSVEGIVINSRDITNQVKGKEHLKLLESVIINTKDAVLITEAEPLDEPGPKIIYVNDAFTKMTGYTAAEVIGKTPRILQGPKSDREKLAKLSKALRNWEPYEMTIVNYKKNGEEFWVNFSVIPVANEKGWYTHWIAIERDVTESILAKEKLIAAKEKAEENELKMKEAQQLAHLGSWYYDAVTKLSHWSEETYRIWGLEPEVKAVDLSNHKDLVHPKDWNRFAAIIKDAIEKGLSYKIEIDLIMQDGSIKTVNSIGSPIFNENNKVIALRGTTQDITERKVIENKLRTAKEKAEENELKMKEAQQIAKLGSWYYDVINKVSEWSDETYNIWEFDPKNNSIGFEDHQERIHPKDWEYFKGVVDNATQKRIPYKMELELIMPDASTKYVNAIAKPVFNENNEVIAFKGTTQDVTERVLIEKELLKAKEKAELNQFNMNQASKLAKIGFWDYNIIIDKLTWSDYIYQLYELTPEDRPIGYNEAKKYFDEASQLKISKATKALLETGKPYDLELKMFNSKREIWVRNVVQPIFNDAKEIIGKRGIVQNITEEKNLRELNRQIGHLAKIGSWEVNLVERTVFWTKEVHLIHETDPETFTPTLDTAINFYREDFHELVSSNVEKCIKTGQDYEMDAVLITANKKEIWVRSSGKAEFINGVCTRIYGSIQDINSRKQSENKLISLSQNLPGLVYEYHIHPDGTDTLKSINGRVKEIWGFTASEVINNTNLIWNQIEAAGEIDEFKTSIQKSIENKTKWQAQVNYVMPTTGKIHTHLGISTPSFLADGTIVFNSMILDITQQAKNEVLLEQTSRMARIGSWELDLLHEGEQKMYWSPIIKEILEIDDEHDTSLQQGIDFHVGESKVRIKKALELLINEGVEFDEEILLKTAKGNLCWCRSIGKSEVINNKRVKIYGSYQDINDQKLAALELEKSLKALKDYKYSLEQSAIIAFTDQKGVITSVNKNFCEISGYSSEEIIGKTYQIINSNHHPKSFFKELWSTISSGKVWRGEIKNKTKQGNYYWVDTTIVPFLNNKNQPTQYLAIRFDITERKKIEEEKNNFQETIENSLNEIYMFNVDTFKFSYVNNGALLNLGYSLEEIKEFSPINIKPQYNLESFQELVEPLKTGELEKIIFFTNHKRKDKSIYPVEVHLSIVKEVDNKNFLAIVLDITERKKAEEMYKLLADNTNDIIALQDEHLTVRYISPAVYYILGYTQQDMLHKKLEDIIHKDDFLNLKEVINNTVLKGGLADALTYRVYNNKGNIVWLESLISKIKENGATTSLLSTSRDITQWMSAKKEIEEYQTSLQKLTTEISMIEEKQKKEIAANIHDHLSQSLVISRMRIVDLEKRTELKNVEEDLEFIKNHISEALENTRKITYELSPPVLYQLGLIDAIDWFADDSQEKYGLEFKFTSNVNSLKLSEFKSILLFRCLQEAVTNIIKYAEATLVTINLNKNQETIILEIEDNGKGFDTSKLNNSISSKSGFGLFAVRERIRNMNGELEITSKINIGTKIKICVPL